MDYKDIEEIKDIKTSDDKSVDVVNDEFVVPEKKSITEVNEHLKQGWVLLGISYALGETGSKIDYYVVGKPKQK